MPQVLSDCSRWGLVTDGDSLQYLVGGVAMATLQPMDFLGAQIGGTDCLDTVSNYDLYGYQGYRSGRLLNLYALGCGHNSYIHGRSAADTYSDMLAVLAKAQATGYTRALWTILPSVEVNNTWRAAVNTLIRDGAVANGYTVIDVAADTTIGEDNDWMNLTYYDPDGVHLTTAGRAIQASYLNAVLQAAGVPLL